MTIHYVCHDEEGNVVDDSTWSEDPVSFEIGAGEVTGNPLFQVCGLLSPGVPICMPMYASACALPVASRALYDVASLT